jgi:Tfp pilus assembly protein PilO
MKPIHKKYFMKAALVWAGCFILFFFIYILVLAPQGKNKKQIEKQLAEKERIYHLAQKATQEETKIQLNEQLKRLQERFKDFVIDFDDLANLTFDISQIAKEKRLDSFSIKGQENRGGPSTFDGKYLGENHFAVSFTGSFSQFATFLNALERHRPVFFIDRFKITHSRLENSDHKVDMDLAVFVKKQQDS